jgi:hypothetical protein
MHTYTRHYETRKPLSVERFSRYRALETDSILNPISTAADAKEKIFLVKKKISFSKLKKFLLSAALSYCLNFVIPSCIKYFESIIFLVSEIFHIANCFIKKIQRRFISS